MSVDFEALAAEPAASRAAAGSSAPSALCACCLWSWSLWALPTEPVWHSTTQSRVSLRLWVGGSKWLSVGPGPGAEVVPSRLGY